MVEPNLCLHFAQNVLSHFALCIDKLDKARRVKGLT